MSTAKEFYQFPILISDIGMQYPTEKSKAKRRFGIYLCQICNKEFKAQVHDINSLRIKSCGCRKIVHGLHSHRLFKTWEGMIRRCTNKDSDNFNKYGGNGISICDRWMNVKNFIDDMHQGYEEGLTLDRINVHGNYEPSNCRWVDKFTQAQNKRLLQLNNSSGYRGVCYDKKRNKWVAMISFDSKRKNLGRFETKIEAAKAYDYCVISNSLAHPLNFPETLSRES